jgi:hypothetical protein
MVSDAGHSYSVRPCGGIPRAEAWPRGARRAPPAHSRSGVRIYFRPERACHGASRYVAEKPYNVLTVRDLIEALGWHLLFERRADEYAGYYHLRFELLRRALGLPSEWTTDQKTPYMIRSLAEAIIHQNFFSGFVEYTPKPGEMKIFDAHRTGIESAQQCVRDRMLDFAEELLLTFWPQVRGKSVRLEKLVSMGLPAHEPDDF